MSYPFELPISTVSNPRNFTLTQFIQQMFVGISGYPGNLVFPLWQVNPPKQPDLPVNWIAIGIAESQPDANAYIGISQFGVASTQRHAKLEVTCHIYGPQAFETAELIRDGFQIPSNLGALATANMGIIEVGTALHVPDLVNERFINRVIMPVYFRRETQRTYPILTFTSASGIIYVPDISQNYTLPFESANNILETQGGDWLVTQSGDPITI